MSLRPLGNHFLFEFLSDTAGGKFIEKTKSGIILTNQDYELQAKYARWGRVIAIGDDVEDFNEGDLVLIEYGMWTTSTTFEDRKYWKSDQNKVIAISNDESVAYTF
jgi:co-chaperonin GroES (HSP10)